MKHKQNGGVFIQLILYATFLMVFFVVVQHFIDPIGYFASFSDKARIKDVTTIQNAIETYYKNNGRYPASSNDYKIVDLTNKSVDWGNSWHAYLDVVPKDPNVNQHYAYIASPNLQAYFLYAALDKPEKTPTSCTGKCNNAPDGACGETVTCNFGVTSANASP